MGRHSEYDKEIADKICEEISTTAKGLREICEPKDMPVPSTVYKWLTQNKEFAEQYARARELQADFMADEIIEIADKCRIGKKTVEKENYTEVTEGDMVDRSRLMIDARKWKASKLAPKKYGDKLDLTSKDDKIQIVPQIIVMPKSE